MYWYMYVYMYTSDALLRLHSNLTVTFSVTDSIRNLQNNANTCANNTKINNNYDDYSNHAEM